MKRLLTLALLTACAALLQAEDKKEDDADKPRIITGTITGDEANGGPMAGGTVTETNSGEFNTGGSSSGSTKGEIDVSSPTPTPRPTPTPTPTPTR